MLNFLIKRPIAVIMTSLGVLLLGFYALDFIPISLMPDIDIPKITVQISADNMSARQLDNTIVSPLRNQLGQLSHLKDIKSESTNENGLIHLRFKHGTKIDYSFIEVNEKIDRTMGIFPKNIKRPKVIKASATDIPVFYLSMSLKDEPLRAKSYDSLLYPVSQRFVEFNRFANQVIKKRIEQLAEVSLVDVSGVVGSEILIIPNLEKIRSIGITLWELESKIKSHDLYIGNLLIKDNQYQYDVRLGSSIDNIREIKELYIRKNGRTYQLKDLAQVLEHPQKRTGLILSEGKEAMTMAIIKQSDAKMGDLKESLNRLLMYLKFDYPDIDFTITRDQTKLLDYVINNLLQSLLWGIVLAFGIMFLFLKNIISPLLIGITIPISLVVSLSMFQLLGISINIISLSGLILGIGLMIDNSIIVIDNITQYRELGYNLDKACVLGTNEVFRPLLSSALTTCAVFVPLIFLSGVGGALFYDQAMAVSIGLSVSLLISLTLLPVLFRLFHMKSGKMQRTVNQYLSTVNKLDYGALYEKGFRWVMRKQHFSWGIAILLLAMALGLYFQLSKSQMPHFQTTETLVMIDWNEQINVSENKRRTQELLLPFHSQLVNHTALIGQQQFIMGKDTDNQTSETTLHLQGSSPDHILKIKNEVAETLNTSYPESIYTFENVDNIFNLIFPVDEPMLVARLYRTDLAINSAEFDLKVLWGKLQELLSRYNVQPLAQQESITLVADQEKLLTYNVNSEILFDLLKSAFNEKEILQISDNENFLPVVLGGKPKSIQQVITETTVRSRDSAFFPIKEFVKMSTSDDLKTVYGDKRGSFVPLALDVEDNRVVSTMSDIRSFLATVPEYDVTFTGDYFNNQKLIGELIVILIISLLLLYFILATQFESFLLPVIILLEVPLALAGAFLFLKLFGMSINLMSMIGIVVMTGIIVNDSILKIDAIVQLERQGYTLLRSLLVAGKRRLKPILMTSLTTILALVPLLLLDGLGVELQAPLAVALIGGMVLGTFVSLYFIPLCYYQLSKIPIRNIEQRL